MKMTEQWTIVNRKEDYLKFIIKNARKLIKNTRENIKHQFSLKF